MSFTFRNDAPASVSVMQIRRGFDGLEGVGTAVESLSSASTGSSGSSVVCGVCFPPFSPLVGGVDDGAPTVIFPLIDASRSSSRGVNNSRSYVVCFKRRKRYCS